MRARAVVAAGVAAGVVAALSAAPARADRPWHGSIGAGSALLLTGHGDDRLRYELAVDIKPASRFGGHLAWRGFDGEHDGLVVGGVVYEAGAARPRLVLDLHGDVGVDLDQKAPVAGGGVRTTLTVWKQLGVALDGGGYLVVDGVEDTRLVLAGSTSLVIRW